MAYWFVFHKDNILLTKNEDGLFSVPCQESVPVSISSDTHIMDVAEHIDDVEVKTMSIKESRTTSCRRNCTRWQESVMNFSIGTGTHVFAECAVRRW